MQRHRGEGEVSAGLEELIHSWPRPAYGGCQGPLAGDRITPVSASLLTWPSPLVCVWVCLNVHGSVSVCVNVSVCVCERWTVNENESVHVKGSVSVRVCFCECVYKCVWM